MGQKLKVHKFKVRPKGNLLFTFPLDMLRYDHCYPSSENDSAKIARCCDLRRYSKGSDNPRDWEIELTAYKHKNWVPTNDRWKSFSWEVFDHTTWD